MVAPDLLGLIAAQIVTDTGDARLTRDLLFERALYQASCKSAIKVVAFHDEGHIVWLGSSAFWPCPTSPSAPMVGRLPSS